MELQLVGCQVGGVGVITRVRVWLEGRAVDLDPPQRTAEQPVRVPRQRRADTAAVLAARIAYAATAVGVAPLPLSAEAA